MPTSSSHCSDGILPAQSDERLLLHGFDGMNIVISGASGLVGTALQERLRAEGHWADKSRSKSPSDANESQWDPVAGTIDTDVIAQADAVINLSGAGIGDRRWSQSYRKTLLDSRTLTTSLLASTLASLANDGTKRTLLNSSAIGIYGARGDEEITESSQHVLMAFSPTSASNGKPPPPPPKKPAFASCIFEPASSCQSAVEY